MLRSLHIDTCFNRGNSYYSEGLLLLASRTHEMIYFHTHTIQVDHTILCLNLQQLEDLSTGNCLAIRIKKAQSVYAESWEQLMRRRHQTFIFDQLTLQTPPEVDSTSQPILKTPGIWRVRILMTQMSPDDVERYLHIKDNQTRSSFEIVPCSLVNKKKAQLKLMDRIEGKKVKFLNSQWLPRTLCGSSIPGEPYFICPVSYSTWRHKHCITMVKPEKRDQQSQTDSNDEYTTEIKRMSEEQESPNHLMLFMLTAGHST